MGQVRRGPGRTPAHRCPGTRERTGRGGRDMPDFCPVGRGSAMLLVLKPQVAAGRIPWTPTGL